MSEGSEGSEFLSAKERLRELSLRWDYANQVLPLENLLVEHEEIILKSKKMCTDKSGLGNSMLEWVDVRDSKTFLNLELQNEFVENIKQKFNLAVVIGVGGSSQGAKAIYEALYSPDPSSFPSDIHAPPPRLAWAGTDLDDISLQEFTKNLDAFSPCLIVISKSGSTLEPALAFRFLKKYIEHRYGTQEAQTRIFVITDPNSGNLNAIAKKNNFPLLPIPSGIGGRFSIFTHVGLFPLAIAGIDIKEFLRGAQCAYDKCLLSNFVLTNPALHYAAARYILYLNGYKIESLCTWSPKLVALTQWWQQLFGESEGKNRRGIFPTSTYFTKDLHSMGQYFQDGERRLFATHLVFHKHPQDKIKIPVSDIEDGFDDFAQKSLFEIQEKVQLATFTAHTEGGLPTLIWDIPECNAFWLGYWAYTNMFACAVSSYSLGLNPFDQPGVERYKHHLGAGTTR